MPLYVFICVCVGGKAVSVHVLYRTVNASCMPPPPSPPCLPAFSLTNDATTGHATLLCQAGLATAATAAPCRNKCRRAMCCVVCVVGKWVSIVLCETRSSQHGDDDDGRLRVWLCMDKRQTATAIKRRQARHRGHNGEVGTSLLVALDA